MLLLTSGAMTLSKLTLLINLSPPLVFLFLGVFCLTWKAFRKLNSKPWLAMPYTQPSGGRAAGVSSKKLKIHFSVYTVPEPIIAWVLRSERGERVSVGVGRWERKRKRMRRKPVYEPGLFSYGNSAGNHGSM